MGILVFAKVVRVNTIGDKIGVCSVMRNSHHLCTSYTPFPRHFRLGIPPRPAMAGRGGVWGGIELGEFRTSHLERSERSHTRDSSPPRRTSRQLADQNDEVKNVIEWLNYSTNCISQRIR